MRVYKFIILFVQFICFVFANNTFNITENNSNETIVSFNIGDVSFEEAEGYHKIQSNSKGSTDNLGEPEIPTYSFNYAIDREKEYSITYSVNSFETFDDVNLYPHQGIIENNVLNKNEILYASKETYPLQNLTYNRMSLRGYELYGIQLIPFEYDFSNKKLKVYTSVDITITESGIRNNSSNIPRSQTFENMYENFVINDNDYQDNRNFQQPSILYIMEDYISIIETLVEWREKQGYAVEVIDRDDISGSFNTGNIKEYIEDALDGWDNPPEFVCLVGDTNGSLAIPVYTVGGGSGWAGAYAESDYPYSLIDGNDNLPEVIIGRISVRSTSQLSTVINKIIGYEKNYSGDDDWLSAAALVGDPYDSGISTVITNQYIEEIMNIHGGITDIRTKYSGTNFDGFMRNQIDDGVAFLNYRGFYGFSNFTTNDVDQLNNGYKLPFLMTLTCGVNNYDTENESVVEALLRAGTVSNPSGAVAVVGTSQSYTHTAFNNIVTMGMYEGMFIDEVTTTGEATVYGKLALNEIYPQNPNNNVYYFASWNNLMGDPATQIWTSSPQYLIVDHNDSINQGSNNFQVQVSDSNGSPYSGAKVTLLKTAGNGVEIQLTSITDFNGTADFVLGDYSSGTVEVLTHCMNCMPIETEFSISNNVEELRIVENSITIDDQSGNNDGMLNPSESVELSFDIENLSIQSISNLNLVLTTTSNFITIENSEVYLGDISPSGALSVSGLSLSANSNAVDSEDTQLRVSISSSGGSNVNWQYTLPLNFYSGNLFLDANIISDGNNNGTLDRGESAVLNFSVLNIGSIPLESLEGSINYFGNFLQFSDTQLNWGDSGVGQGLNSNNITVTANQSVVNGSLISIPISFTTDSGFEINEIVQIQVGEVSITDPLGPDAYGYYIYDMYDDDYDLAPDYDWIEIDPGLGGDGQYVDVDDDGNNDDDVTTVDLPFTFTFYGIDYNEVSICSNGWISFGETNMSSFRNYTLPGPGGPSPIVAVFWDDLKTTSGGEIYSYYDSENDSFIIEWSELRTYLNNSVESFQIILYNTGWQTHTGDDEMKLQFKEFNNTSVGDYPVGNYDGAVIHGQYCTVGIENHLQSDGLQYTFNNSYPLAARQLSDNSALFISNRNSALSAIPSLDYNYDSFSFEIESNEQTSTELALTNDGEPGSVLYYDINLSPFSSSVNQTDEYGYAWAESNNDPDVSYHWVDIEDEHTVLEFENNDGGALISLDFNFPFYENTYGLCAVMANGWLAFGSTSQEWNNGSVFDEDSPRSAILGFWDDLNPVSADNPNGSGYVKFHGNSERAVIWFDHVIHWTSFDRIYDFQIVLYPNGKINLNYREMMGDTDSATIGIMDANGNYGLEVIYNQSDFINDQMSVVFDTVPSWVDLSDTGSGQIISGDSDYFNLSVNSNNLSNGNYRSYIVINTNATIGSLFMPVDLSVGTLDLGDLNQDGIYNVLDIVTLVGVIMGNYVPTDLELSLSDLNEDNQIDVLDVVMLVNLVLSI